MVELDRPERARRRNGAKSDPLDAERAAREAMARTRLGIPRAGGDRQALSVLLAARRSAVEAASLAQRQLFSLVIAAPEPLRTRFRGNRIPAMVVTTTVLRLHPSWDTETTTTVTVPRSLARRARDLAAEAPEHEKAILAVVRAWRPDLLDQVGVGPIVAATVLCAWSHPGRVHPEAAFAMLAGVAPIPANSGQTTTRYRLNPHGDRQLNRALHTVALARQRYHQPNPRLHRPPHQRGQDPARDQTLPQALHRPRPLPAPREPLTHHLTSHRSVSPIRGGGGGDAERNRSACQVPSAAMTGTVNDFTAGMAVY